MKAIIIDIDGTLSDSSKRVEYVTGEKKEWKMFYAGMEDDSVNEWCRGIVNLYHGLPYVRVVLMTGRPNKYREATERWLSKHNIPYDGLLMRQEKDMRPDFEVKKDLYYNEMLPHLEGWSNDKVEVIFAIDDRQQVIDMWRSIGIPALQCAKGDF